MATEFNKNGLLGRLKAGGASLAIVAGMFVSVQLLQFKAASSNTLEAAPPLPVLTERVLTQASYSLSTDYTGVLEAQQQTSLAFQVGGEIVDIFVDEGDVVTKGQVLARLDTRRLNAGIQQVEAQIAETAANVELAELTEKRQKTLLAGGNASEQRYDEARINTAALKARLASLNASLNALRVDMDWSMIKAPFDGIIAARRADIGAVGAAGAPVLDLVEKGGIRARIGLPEDVLKGLEMGDKMMLTVNGQPVEGRLQSVRPDIDPFTRTRAALFEMKPDNALPYGELVRVGFPREIQEEGIWIPAQALRAGPKGLWLVYLYDDKAIDGDAGRAAVEAVEVLHAEEGRVYVRGNLPAGAELISTGLQRIVPGQLIQRAMPGTASSR